MSKRSRATEISWMLVLGMSCLACVVGRHTAYEAGMREQLPSGWEADANWSVVLVDRDGSILRTVTVRLTSDPGSACWAGNWLKAEVLSVHPSQGRLHSWYIGRAAYATSGAGIQIILSSDYCDADHRLYGKVAREGIFGEHSSDSISGEGENGRFYAVPIHHPNAD